MLVDSKYKNILVNELCEFIRIPSISDPEGGQEGQLQAVIADRMRELGARVRTFEADDYPEFYKHSLCSRPDRQYKNRPTVIGEIGPKDAPALIVIAHSDTVPISEPDQWTFDPFCGEIHDGKVLGLGATDDKWGLASLLSILRVVKDSDISLKKRLIFASTIDEENGVCNGLLLLMLAGITAQEGLYLDGTLKKVYIGNLGGSFLFLKPHTTLDEEKIDQHAELLQSAIEKYNRSRMSAYDQPFFTENLRREQSVILHKWKDDRGYYFNLAFYTLPGDKRSEICAGLEAMVRETLKERLNQYEISYLQPWFEPSIVDPNTPIVKHMIDTIPEITGAEAILASNQKIDAFVLNNYAGIPTMSFGPSSQVLGRGAFHQPDEYLNIDEFWDAFQIACNAVCKWLIN